VVGEVFFSDPATASPYQQAFRQSLWELGYVGGRNIRFESRYADASNEHLHQLAAELVRLKVDIIFVGAGRSLDAARSATRSIPIVMAQFGDAVRGGLVASLSRQGVTSPACPASRQSSVVSGSSYSRNSCQGWLG
jgi:putative ABC transport system substrate-binding protein